MGRARALLVAGLAAAPTVAFAEGMPQLDFANPLTVSQVVWLVIIFVVLYQALARWALPKVAEVLALRADSIGRDLEAAHRAKAESDEAVEAMTVATRQAHAEAQAEIARAVATAKASVAAQSAELQDRLEAQLQDAEQRIGAARVAAMGALRQVATVTAVDVVARLTGRAASAGGVEAAVGDVLAARGLG